MTNRIRIKRRCCIAVARLVLLSGVFALAATARAEVRIVPCDPQLSWEKGALSVMGKGFTPAPEGCGTTDKRALVAKMATGRFKAAVALDYSKPELKAPDIVRLNPEGELAFDKQPAFAMPAPKDPTVFKAELEPKEVGFKVDGKSVAAIVRGTFHFRAPDSRTLSITLGSAAEDEVKFGEAKHKVRCMDSTLNQAFGDAGKCAMMKDQAVGWRDADAVIVDQGDGDFAGKVSTALYGQPIRVDGKWYDVSLAADGKTITAEPTKAKIGTIKVNQAAWQMRLAGKRNFLLLSGGKDEIEIPADEYTLSMYGIPDLAGLIGRKVPVLQGRGPGEGVASWSKPIDVPAGKTTAINIGSPLTVTVDLKQKEGVVDMNITVLDAGGGKVAMLLLENGAKPPPPKLTVVDDAGKAIYQATLSYG